ncbi:MULTISPECIES: hypothetical protein [unclassified Streptomyces]|uniref:wHTH domain-containing protein n=1 Tax=unclassified Streptomyces TaxID=2593676 RepID=UPI000B85E53B|nr:MULTISPECIES: hypothetical protein [unclassified Streptomyces]MYZ39298.1 hypothetical protein [Streptomyces sp. SID4917]
MVSALARPPYGTVIRNQEISSWLPKDPTNARVPRDPGKVWALVRLWCDWAGEKEPNEKYWRTLVDRAQPARNTGGTAAHGTAVGRDGQPAESADPWARLVETSAVWNYASEDFDHLPLKEQAVTAALRLAALRDEAESELTEDPWWDGQLAQRISKSLLLALKTARKQQDSTPVSLVPGEAALLALLPLLHHVSTALLAARLRTVGPADLGQPTSDDRPERADTPERGWFAGFVRRQGYDRLVRRANLPALQGRDGGRAQIGWWLFHQWLAQDGLLDHTKTVRTMLSAAGRGDDSAIWQVLGELRVARLLGTPRLKLNELCDSTSGSSLYKYDPVFSGDPDEQNLRGVLVGVLYAVAHAFAIEITDLSPVVVKRVGIPGPVDLEDLHGILRKAEWRLQPDGRELNAGCRHPAVVAALREHVTRVDTLLRAVRHAAETQEPQEALRGVPAHAWADGVRHVNDKGQRVSGSEVPRFRLDDESVQELLMGENLYGDRALAVRELYQNALDACRFRQARELAFLQTDDRDSSYNGRIWLEQGTDESGRAYLDCRDNGVGMREEDLIGVFSQAGARFTQQPDFLKEEAGWSVLEEPVRFRANSRFGIGVLSYFMLADEIRVTTRRTDAEGVKGRELTAVITGPGHFFRIDESASMGRKSGTWVRLYLRDGATAPSCVKVLRRLLGIAEFTTTATHGREEETWDPWVLKARVRPSWEQEPGIDAHGGLVQRREGAQDGQVVWCEHGGGLLVDGLLARPAVRRGILAGDTDDGLRGAVVNLAGATSPPRLSVDRTQILDDVSASVKRLLETAAEQLVSSEETLLDLEWISAVGDESPQVADVVARAATARGYTLRLNDRRFETAVAGCFPPDAQIAAREEPKDVLRTGSAQVRRVNGEVPDHVLLWRLLAHGPSAETDALAEVVPEIADAGRLLPALPSDLKLLTVGEGAAPGPRWPLMDERDEPGRILWAAMRTGLTLRQVARRVSALNVQPLRYADFADDSVPDPVDLALLSQRMDGRPGWLAIEDPVPPGHLVRAHVQLGIGTGDAARRMERYGFDVTCVGHLPDAPDPADLPLLDYNWGEIFARWLPAGQPVRPEHLVHAGIRLGKPVSLLCRVLASYGLTAELGAIPERPDGDDRRLLSHDPARDDWYWLDIGEPVPPGHLVRAADVLGWSLARVASRLRGLGFTVPDTLPDRPYDRHDQALLSISGTNGPPWWTSGDRIHIGHLMNAREFGISPNEAAGRLAAYGLSIPDEPLPEQPDRHDLVILSADRDGLRPWLEDERLITPYRLIEVADRLRVPISYVVERLAAYGLSVSRTPPQDRETDDVRLLERDLETGGSWLRDSNPVPLSHLIRARVVLGTPILEVAARLRVLGLDVPDPAVTIRTALDRVPRSVSG